METMVGISLYSILISTSKNALSFLFLLMFSTKLEIREEQVLPGS
jgi:hypothetical protein